MFNKIRDLFEKSPKRWLYLASFVLPCLIILVVWAFNQHFPFGPKSLMAVDFGQQYIGFYAYLKETILSGNWSAFFHSFEKSLGGEMIGVLGYYIFSPFNIFYILLPLAEFKWAVFLTLLLRYGFMGLTFSHLLIKRYQGAERSRLFVPIFATAYALSGMIVSYQMNPIFYDAMIWLPLIITYLEEFLDQKSTYKYVLVLALALLSQFYMGYMICIFVAIYACYYMAPKLAITNLKEKMEAFFLPLIKTLAYSVLAAGTTFVILYPLILNLMRSKGAYENVSTFAFTFQINPFDIISKLMIGGFDNESWSAGPSLPNIFVGSVALIGFFLYFQYSQAHAYRKLAAGAITAFFVISFVHEWTSKIWHMGQNPAGFFFRFSWIVSFFMVLLAFQTLQAKPKLSRKTLANGVSLSVLAVLYVVYHTYTYIQVKQPEALTTLAMTHPKTVYAIFIALIVATGSLIYHYGPSQNKPRLFVTIASVILVLNLGVALLFNGYLFSQLLLTLLTWLAALFFYHYHDKKLGRILIAILTVLELGYNAYLSQTTIGYADAYKFSDLAVKLRKMGDQIETLNKDGNPSAFYRVGTDFFYSKVDPLIGSYNGLSNFSSSMEKTTVDLFASMGDVGGNASTFYANGTALTDALYSVRYFVERKDYTNEDVENNPKLHFFSKHVTRKDLQAYYTQVYEDETFVIYENPNVLPLAFATNYLTHNIQFGLNNPVSNQNIILNSMSNQEKEIFQRLEFNQIDLENMVYVEENGQQFYRRVDKSQMGTIRLRFVPQTNDTYYFQAPLEMRSSMGNMNILLNDQWYNYTQGFDQVQLWNLAHNAQGQEIVLKFETSTMDEINFTNFALVRADTQEIQRIVADRAKQGLVIESLSDTKIKGSVNVTDDSEVMMTTIPYSPGWKVKVDGKTVETSQALGSLLAFPITAGKHEVVMTFTPPGLWTGVLISLLSIGTLIYLYKRDKTAEGLDQSVA